MRYNEYINTITGFCLKYGYNQSAVERHLAKGETLSEVIQELPDSQTRIKKRLESLLFMASVHIREYRTYCIKMHQPDFAEYIHAISGKKYSIQMISSVENGRKIFSLDVLIALAKHSNSSLDWFLGVSKSRKAYDEAPTDHTWNEQLEYMMQYRHISEKELLSKLENMGFKKVNLKKPKAKKLIALAEILETSTDFLVGMTDTVSPAK